jgi:E3 ubiquitin-protein ligase AIP2
MILVENSNQLDLTEEDDEAMLDEVYKKAPPASKKVVSDLERVVISSNIRENAEKNGGKEGDASCPVCMQDLFDGDTVVVLPCKHGMHPECIGPWLEQTNSCPTCRAELPTDDARYEKYKVKKVQDEIDRKGAANAISHNEFFYI